MGRMLLLALPLLATACQDREAQSVAAENRAEAEARDKLLRAEIGGEAADPNSLLPGRWETKQEITGVTDASLPADSKAEIAKTSSAIDQCLPPEEARRPDPNFFAGGDESECQYTSFSMQAGRLDAALSCSAGAGTITMKLKGTHTHTTYALDATATNSGGGASPISTSARITGTWLEACASPEGQRAPDPATVNRQAQQAPQPPAQQAGVAPSVLPAGAVPPPASVKAR